MLWINTGCYFNAVDAAIAFIIGNSGRHFQAAITIVLIDAVYVALNDAHKYVHTFPLLKLGLSLVNLNRNIHLQLKESWKNNRRK